jgi:ABC-type lipoprotein export system ATPase subunit
LNEEQSVHAGQDDFVVIAESLTKSFTSGPEDVVAVDSVDLRLPRGKMIALRGSSGSGKSTLLNLLGALDRPTSGQLRVDTVNVSTLAGRGEVDYRRRKVGFVFQSFNLIPQLSALENVMLPMDFIDINSHDQADRARQLLKQVGIDLKRQFHRPAKLSGGQQQRVAIARALANDPPLILADEPTANLDNKTGRIIVELLHGLTRDGRTVVVATHDTAIAHTADLIVEMEDGRIMREHRPSKPRAD